VKGTPRNETNKSGDTGELIQSKRGVGRFVKPFSTGKKSRKKKGISEKEKKSKGPQTMLLQLPLGGAPRDGQI